MTKMERISLEYKSLIEKELSGKANVENVQIFINEVRLASSQIWDIRERDQLSSYLRYWADFIHDRTGIYPNIQLLPSERNNSLEKYGWALLMIFIVTLILGALFFIYSSVPSSMSIIISVLSTVVAIIAVVFAYKYRQQIPVHSAAVAVSDMLVRVTQRTGGRKAKAKLITIEGISTGEKKVFDLYGETPIGRDRAHNEIVFAQHTSISREHAIIHENRITGEWTIEDRESANGTYVNGRLLEPFEKNVVLKNDDVIELGQAERGGIKFRFIIINNTNNIENSDQGASSNITFSENKTNLLEPSSKDYDPSQQEF